MNKSIVSTVARVASSVFFAGSLMSYVAGFSVPGIVLMVLAVVSFCGSMSLEENETAQA